MKILFDARALQSNIDGISRYTIGLLRALTALRPDWDFKVLAGEDSVELLSGLPVETVICHVPRFKPGEDRKVYPFIEQSNANLYFNLSMAGPRPALPTVITVYDLLVLNQPGYFGSSMLKNIFYRAVFRRKILKSMKHASAVSVPSNFTKKEVTEAFPGHEDRIFRTGAGQDLFLEAPSVGERDDFLLYVGNARAYKNLSRLIIGYCRLKAMNRDFPELVMVVRKDRAFREFSREIEDCSTSDGIRVLSHIGDHQLKELYEKCMGLVMPSLREGFGFPALEAMSAGAPVIVSSGTALDELTGQAGLKVNPQSMKEIMHGMALLFSSEELRKDLSVRSLKRSAEFSWRDAATIVADKIQEIVS